MRTVMLLGLILWVGAGEADADGRIFRSSARTSNIQVFRPAGPATSGRSSIFAANRNTRAADSPVANACPVTPPQAAEPGILSGQVYVSSGAGLGGGVEGRVGTGSASVRAHAVGGSAGVNTNYSGQTTEFVCVGPSLHGGAGPVQGAASAGVCLDSSGRVYGAGSATVGPVGASTELTLWRPERKPSVIESARRRIERLLADRRARRAASAARGSSGAGAGGGGGGAN